MTNLEWLQFFCLALSDGDWEHGLGPKICSIDNPGWCFQFPVIDTPFENLPFENYEVEKSEHDWIFLKKEKGSFIANCGPLNLDEVIGLFRKWIVDSGIDIPPLTDQEADAERTKPLRNFVRLQKKSWRDG